MALLVGRASSALRRFGKTPTRTEATMASQDPLLEALRSFAVAMGSSYDIKAGLAQASSRRRRKASASSAA